jgi:predicted esterase
MLLNRPLLCAAAALALALPTAAQDKPSAKPAEKSAQTPKTAPAADQDLKIGGDARKRYFLINPNPSSPPPADGYKLLVVLPGGDGSAEFHPFVKNLASQALPPGYLVAQAVAPAWSTAEDRIVWPTSKSRDPAMKFTAEEFIDAIVKDARSKAAIDPRCVFLLGWSSGGPPSYAAACRKDSPITGAFVAMSVFKPEHVPSLDAAKGKAFYILHSPQDTIPMSFPQAAKSQLAAKGAATKLDTYEGGHGWHGDVMGNIRKGVTWLESEAGKRK